MTHGPCGGVRADGSCEIGGACPYVDLTGGSPVATPEARAAWAAVRETAETAETAAPGAAGAGGPGPGPVRALLPEAQAFLDLMATRPIVIADLPSTGPDAEMDRALAAILAGSVDATLLGDAPWARVQLPPAVRGANVAREGLMPWCGVNCRDRNRAALESELAGLTAMGVPAMHCVTGDHPVLGHRDDARPVFDLDSTELAALATHTTPLLVSAAESPASPPAADRSVRAAAKLAAGAQLLFVNHCSPERFAEFAAELEALVPGTGLIACVPLVTSHAAAERITKYLHAPPAPELLAALDAPDPTAAAVALAVAHAERLLEIPGVVGIDFSAPAGPGEAHAVTAALATAGRALGASASA